MWIFPLLLLAPDAWKSESGITKTSPENTWPGCKKIPRKMPSTVRAANLGKVSLALYGLNLIAQPKGAVGPDHFCLKRFSHGVMLAGGRSLKDLPSLHGTRQLE